MTTETPGAPSAATIAKIRTASAAPIEVRHSDAAAQWATSEERTIVFSVINPNPDHEAWLAAKAEFERTHDGDTEGVERAEFAEPEPDAELRTDYTMPAKPNAGLSLVYLRKARENADLALSWLLELALGVEGYDALADELSGYDNPDEAQLVLNSTVARIQRVAMGGLEGKA